MKIPRLIPHGPLANERLVAWQQFVLAIIAFSFVGYILHALIHENVPAPNRETLNLMLGAILGTMATVSGFYFPSSVGSKVKDENQGKALDAMAKLSESVAAAGTGSGGQPAADLIDPATGQPVPAKPPG